MTGDVLPWPAEIYADALGGTDRLAVFSRSPCVRLYRRALARHVRAGMAVVDIGCGFAIGGCHLATMGELGLTYTGVEVASAVSERARAVLAGLALRGDVVSAEAGAVLDAHRGAFDLALCNHSFHACLSAAEGSGGQFAERVAASLRPGGILIVADGFVAEGASAGEAERIRAYAARAAAHVWTGAHRDPGSVSPAQMESMFRRVGLVVLERDEAPWFALGVYQGMPHARYALRVLAKPVT